MEPGLDPHDLIPHKMKSTTLGRGPEDHVGKPVADLPCNLAGTGEPQLTREDPHVTIHHKTDVGLGHRREPQGDRQEHDQDLDPRSTIPRKTDAKTPVVSPSERAGDSADEMPGDRSGTKDTHGTIRYEPDDRGGTPTARYGSQWENYDDFGCEPGGKGRHHGS